MKTLSKTLVFFYLYLLVGCTAIPSVVLEKPDVFVVYVEGAVYNPGEFSVSAYAYFEELLLQLQLKEDSDVSMFNKKMILHHHDHIVIPTISKKVCVSINSASLEQLISLPNVGEVIAQRIIEHRNNHGLFQQIEDITAVKGIGDKTFEKMKDYVCL